MIRRRCLLLVFLPLLTRGQDSVNTTDNTVFKLNVLAPPASPGASLLGIAPSEILKPVDPKAFAASVQNATNSFNALPKSFAIDIALAKFFNGKAIDYDRFASNKIPNNGWQSWVVSAAFVNDTVMNVKTPQLAVGTKISIFRGCIGKETNRLLDESTKELGKLIRISNQLPVLKSKPIVRAQFQVDSLQALAKALLKKPGIGPDNPAVRQLLDKATNLKATINDAELAALTDTINVLTNDQAMAAASLRRLKQIAREIKYTRYGFKLDAAAGWVFSFPNESFRAGSATKFGAWLTPAWDWENSHFSALGILRYLLNPDNPLADTEGVLKGKKVQTFDGGARLIYGGSDQRVAVSTEVIRRSIVSKQDPALAISPSWRVVFNAEYELSSTTRLTLSLGKDFDNTVLKQGNVVGFLNLIGAFGGDTVKLSSPKVSPP